MKKYLFAAIFLALIAVVVQLVRRQRAEWTGLTEPELRAKIDTKLASRVPDEKRDGVADRIVSGMRDRGMVADAPAAAGNA